MHPLDKDRYEVLLDSDSTDDSALFAVAFQQLFGALAEPRYLVVRDAGVLPDERWNFVWRAVRRLFTNAPAELVYYPVPDCLAANKQKAESFAGHWQHYVGGGELIYTKPEAGQSLLAQARMQPRPRVKQMAIELWR